MKNDSPINTWSHVHRCGDHRAWAPAIQDDFSNAFHAISYCEVNTISQTGIFLQLSKPLFCFFRFLCLRKWLFLPCHRMQTNTQVSRWFEIKLYKTFDREEPWGRSQSSVSAWVRSENYFFLLMKCPRQQSRGSGVPAKEALTGGRITNITTRGSYYSIYSKGWIFISIRK